MKILCQKNLRGGLDPRDEEAKEALKKFKGGSDVWVEVKKPRNARFHRMYFALLTLVFDNQDRYDNFENFRKAVQVAAGHVDQLITLDGEVLLQPKSVSYDSLDDIEFGKIFAETMRVCLDYFLQDADDQYVRDEVLRVAA